METRANYVLIGAFTLLAAVLAAIFAIWLGGLSLDRPRTDYDVRFQAPVRGVQVGGEVRFNGIKVGEVTRLRLDPDDPNQVFARIRIDSATPIRQASYAQLEPLGLTGVAYIQIFAGDPKSPLVRRGLMGPVPVLRSEEGQLDRLFAGGEGVLEGALQMLDRVGKVLDEKNLARINAILANTDDTTAILARNEAVLTETTRAASAVADAATAAATTLTKVDGAVASIDSAVKTYDEVGQTVGSQINGLSDDTRATLEELRGAAVGLRQAAEATETLAQDTGGAVRAADRALVRAGDETIPEITLAAQELRQASAAIERLAVKVERDPAALVAGSGTKRTVEWRE